MFRFLKVVMIIVDLLGILPYLSVLFPGLFIMFRFLKGGRNIVDLLGILPYLVYPIANLYYSMFRFQEGKVIIANLLSILPILTALLLVHYFFYV